MRRSLIDTLKYYFPLRREIKESLAASYFPELPRKAWVRRFAELVLWRLKYRESNTFYMLYGFDALPSPSGYPQSAYEVDSHRFIADRARSNMVSSPVSQVVLLRDKLMFYQYMRGKNIPTPTVYGMISRGVLYNSDMEEKQECEIPGLLDGEVFLKEADGQCASFVKKLAAATEWKQYKKEIGNGHFILQEKAVQHPELNRLNPCAINTLRMVTVNHFGKVYILATVLRVGTKKCGNVDNWAAGGLAIGVSEDGHLLKYGFHKPGKGGKQEMHPDTGVRFEGFAIPYWKEACEMALKAHAGLYNVRSIGWDIAITEQGPCFIEGNDNWEIALMQAALFRGFRKEWKEISKDANHQFYY